MFIKIDKNERIRRVDIDKCRMYLVNNGWRKLCDDKTTLSDIFYKNDNVILFPMYQKPDRGCYDSLNNRYYGVDEDYYLNECHERIFDLFPTLQKVENKSIHNLLAEIEEIEVSYRMFKKPRSIEQEINEARPSTKFKKLDIEEWDLDIDKSVSMGICVEIGNHIVIGAGTEIMANAKIESNVKIGKYVKIGKGVEIGDGSIIPDGTVLNKYQEIE